MTLDPYDIQALLTEEDWIQLQRHCGQDKEYVNDVILNVQENAHLRKLAEYMAMERKMGIGSKEVQVMMREMYNSNYKRV